MHRLNPPSPLASPGRTQEPTGERWQLWRQDDHGTRFLMAEFDDRDEAQEEMEKWERRGHKQTYWVSQREKPDASGGGRPE